MRIPFRQETVILVDPCRDCRTKVEDTEGYEETFRDESHARAALDLYGWVIVPGGVLCRDCKQEGQR